ncbi:MAG: NAD-dependent epimerase/dehydratase family protein [Lachnospiraceae bacterium]
MNVVVTGATSFIGAATVKNLLQAQHQVFAVIRPGSRNISQLTSRITGCRKNLLKVITLDLQAIETLATAIDGADTWIHIGWDGAGSDNRMNRKLQQVNIRYSLQAVRTAARLGCRRFIFTGSQAEYGIHHQTITEDTPASPVSEYGKAKLEFGTRARKLCSELGMEYIHTRIFSIYGPGDHPWSLINTCLSAWHQNEEMSLGECTQQWNFLYIEDMAAALLHLLTEGSAGVYNIASEDTRTLREYIEELYVLCGKNGSFVFGTREQNAEGPADLMPDIYRICRETAWRPTTSFMEGIYETMHSMQDGTA